MAASDFEKSDEPPRQGGPVVDRLALLPADAIAERFEEGVNRATRHGMPLSCLLVTVGNLREVARTGERGRAARACARGIPPAQWRRVGRDLGVATGARSAGPCIIEAVLADAELWLVRFTAVRGLRLLEASTLLIAIEEERELR